jgi:pyruvate ferredoxin oxidoreductase alpha subunit
MLKQIEGSQAMAEAIALCRPQVICAYPITPQTHIVEGVGALVRTGELQNCEFINVESEFAALSVAIGASAAGARAYTATASQGLLYMAEAVYNASGLGLPIVMTLGNRAIGAPINIWNDHSDAMSMRDSGWVMLFAETNQEAVDLHIQAFRLAEEMSLPVMVCVDGFILTHAVERVDIPTQEQVDAFLPKFEPVQVLDPAWPVSIGAMVGPDAFTEVRFLQHYKQTQALGLISELAEEFREKFGRDSGGRLRTYRCEDAEIIAVAMGSVCGTIKDVIDELRATGMKIGLLTIVAFRPFPLEDIKRALEGAKHVVVIEKSVAVGMGGQLVNNIDYALRNLASRPRIHSVVAGLGGRPITRRSLADMFQLALTKPWEDTLFLDLNERVVGYEIHRRGKLRRSGPMAEHILKQLARFGPPQMPGVTPPGKPERGAASAAGGDEGAQTSSKGSRS